MDIDDFLDGELSQVGVPPPPDVERQKTKMQAEMSNQFSPSFERIREDLSKGNLDVAEKSYAMLWNLLSQEKLKWNKELYEQLLVTSRQFSSTLNSAYNDLKRKANHIYELRNRARSALKEEKRELAFKLYSEISDINNSISSIFFEEKKVIREQIMSFTRSLGILRTMS